MALYEDHILPVLVDAVCGAGAMTKLRLQVVPRCAGTVLEVGAGSGLNFTLYDAATVDEVIALEPSEAMRRRATDQVDASPVPVRWVGLPGERIPLADASVDTVLLTFTLCTIPDAPAALAQMYRVLKPDGVLRYCEHGLSPDPGVAAWQHRITPTWKRWAGGCHLDRSIPDLLTDAGFVLTETEEQDLPGSPRVFGHIFLGAATKA